MKNKTGVDRVFYYLDTIIEALLFAITLAMLLAGVAQIVSRYVIQSSLSWSEELMRYLYVWLSMVGTALALRRHQFTVIESIVNKIGKKSIKAGKAMWIMVELFQILFFVYLTLYGWCLVSKNLNFDSPALGVSMGLVYLALPLGGFLGLLYCGISIWDLSKKEAQI